MAEERRREPRVSPKGRVEGGTSKSRGRESAKRSTADARQKEAAAAAERAGRSVSALHVN